MADDSSFSSWGDMEQSDGPSWYKTYFDQQEERRVHHTKKPPKLRMVPHDVAQHNTISERRLRKPFHMWVLCRIWERWSRKSEVSTLPVVTSS
jgi:hypothetical protein